jgi:hypothetical protein
VTTAQILRVYGDKTQVIDSEYASDKAQILAMSLCIRDLERKLALEAEEDAESGGAGGEVEVLSWRDFFGVVKEMRAAQKKYFRTREREDLVRSKCLEKAVDKAVAAHEEKEKAK